MFAGFSISKTIMDELPNGVSNKYKGSAVESVRNSTEWQCYVAENAFLPASFTIKARKASWLNGRRDRSAIGPWMYHHLSAAFSPGPVVRLPDPDQSRHRHGCRGVCRSWGNGRSRREPAPRNTAQPSAIDCIDERRSGAFDPTSFRDRCEASQRL